MSDLITAIGLLFFIEGLLLAMFPSRIKIIMQSIEKISDSKLRLSGIVFFAVSYTHLTLPTIVSV